jgi:hypothetical protein
MAGYSGKPLWEKLGVKPACRIALIDAPNGAEALLEPMHTTVEFCGAGTPEMDIVMLFCMKRQRLDTAFPAAIQSIKQNGMIWVAWPKRSAKADTDLDENVVRETGLELGVVDVKVCAIDEFWSGLKFVIRLKDRQPGSR